MGSTDRARTATDGRELRDGHRPPHLDLYETNGQPIALIELVPEPSHLLVENLAVLPAYQGQGIGDALAPPCGRGRSLRLPELRLYTNAAFTSNVAFYARRNFEVFGREPLALGGELVHMKRGVD